MQPKTQQNLEVESFRTEADGTIEIINENAQGPDAKYRIWRDMKLLEKKMQKAARHGSNMDRRLQNIRKHLVNVSQQMDKSKEYDIELCQLHDRQLEIQQAVDYVELSQVRGSFNHLNVQGL
jgi:hypothetical protein